MSSNPIIQLAILKGLLDPNIASSLQSEQDPVASLIKQGLLDPADVERLTKELALDGFDTMASPTENKSAQFQTTTDRIAVFGRYVQLEFLGQGGMARVYKAYDPSLGRHVALKFVKVDDPKLAQRLLLEARSQARIEHEHVCKIYEAGEAGGKTYIAMQFISGQTLKQLKDSLSLKQKVELIRQVTDGVHAAHKAGLIHRDLKPTNILIEQKEAGPTAYVMDFGLAHESQAPSLTMSGIVVGTPSYMSPEQAKGQKDKMDPRTDIYGIGATLYEAVTGHPPFDGQSSTEILMKVLDQEPLAPRKIDPTLPADLQTIILKCLDKNPEQRYSSARALSDDLSRFQDGDPILARRPTFTYRINKKIRKNPVVSGLVTAAVLAVIIFAAIAGVVQWRSKEQAKLFQEFGQEVTRIEAIMRYGYLLPLHDVQQEKNQVVQRLEGINKRMKNLGSMAYGPGNYSLGRGYLSLHRYQDAYDHLIQAWQKYNYREPEVANALGLSLAMLYQQTLNEAEHTYSKDQLAEKKLELQKKYRDPALKFIRGSTSESPEYVNALISYLEQNYSEALKKSELVTQKVGWMYEGLLLQGNIFTAMGNDQVAIGNYAAANEFFDRARKAYLAAAQKGQSDPQVYEGLCSLQAIVQDITINEKGSCPPSVTDEGIGYCQKALQADSQNVTANLLASSIYGLLAYEQSVNGKDSSTAVANGVRHIQAALKIDPGNSSAFRRLGHIYSTQASVQIYAGKDPVHYIELANTNFEKARKKMPEDYELLSLIGNNIVSEARYEAEAGKNPTKTLDEGMAVLQKALNNNPKGYRMYSNLGTAYYTKGSYENDSGQDPRKSLQEAIRLFKKSLEINPKYANPYEYLGVANLSLGYYLADIGADGVPALNESIAAYEKCLTLAPDDAFSFVGIGTAYRKKADLLQRQGKDPTAEVDAARNAFQKSLKANNQIVQTYAYYAENEFVAARHAIAQNKSPQPFLQNAERILNEGKKLGFDCTDCINAIVGLHLVRAQYLVSIKQSAQKEIQSGIDISNRGLNQRANADLNGIRGELYLLQAKLLSGSSQTKAAQQAKESFDQAFNIKPVLKNQYQDAWKEAQQLTLPDHLY
jgi:eukaryotic-like serine/threonine-protein kinase